MPGRGGTTPAVSCWTEEDGAPTPTECGTPAPTSFELSGDGVDTPGGERCAVTSVSNGGREYFSPVPALQPAAWSGTSRLMGATTAVGTWPPPAAREAEGTGGTRVARPGWIGTAAVDAEDRTCKTKQTTAR